MNPPTIGALFAGYGGLDMAVEMVIPEARVAWVSEFEPAPSRILAHHWPDAPNHGDVTRIDWSAVEPVDIITGGSPCQDLSNAGKRAGMKAGTRSGLWAPMCDAIETIRPNLVVWENVRGALSAEATAGDVESCEFCMGGDGEPHLRALGRVLGDLAELGYDAAWCGLRAADVGAPHGRWRVFVLAWPATDAERDGRDGWARNTVGDTLGRTTSAGAGEDVPRLTLLPTPRATDGSKGGPNQRGSSGDLMLPSAVTLLPTPKAADWKASGSVSPGVTKHVESGFGTLPEQVAVAADAGRFGDYAPAIARWEAVIGRPAPPPTEPTGKGGAHRLSPRFVEWMMGLPDGWVTDVPDISRIQALKALGNGVVPQQAAAALRHLLTVREAA